MLKLIWIDCKCWLGPSRYALLPGGFLVNAYNLEGGSLTSRIGWEIVNTNSGSTLLVGTSDTLMDVQKSINHYAPRLNSLANHEFET